MSFTKVLSDIKALKIQGAEAVAIAAAKSLLLVVKGSKAHTPKELYSELVHAKNSLVLTRPTEPAMRNALLFILKDLNHCANTFELAKKLEQRINEALLHFSSAKAKIREFGRNKIMDGMVVFTHCHSSTVVDILLDAKKAGRKFEVHSTETRPLFQGRKTAEELSAAGIPVKHYIDSAALFALQKADICLFGADAVQSDGRVINKVGSSLFIEIAHKHDIPVFCCLDSWKYDHDTVFGKDEIIEKRASEEVWKNPPKKVQIVNYAFEGIDPHKITGIISEFGIYSPTMFAEIAIKSFSWLD